MLRGMGGFEEYSDPRLVALYDDWEPERDDLAFFLDLATRISAESVVDIGCGTGTLAVELARRGHRVTGIDPSPAMLAYARTRPGAQQVRWILGGTSQLPRDKFDLAVMTGHVVQVIHDDQLLLDMFGAIRRCLRPGGRLAFDSRNLKTAGNWADWTRDRTLRTLAGGVQVWIEDAAGGGDLISYTVHYRLPDGQELLSRNDLRYRSFTWLAQALRDTGFQVDPVDADDDDHVFLATPSRHSTSVPAELRPIRAEDWEAVYRWARLIEVCRYQPWGPNTPEQTREFIQEVAREWGAESQQNFPFAILVDGTVSGLATLHLRPFQQGEITYSLHPEQWGRGIATDVAGRLMRLGFTELGLHRIYGTCDPRNLASGKVMRKAGMVHEGRLRQNVLIRDGWRDSDVYAILKPEWETR